MATHRVSLLLDVSPDASGNVFNVPYDATLGTATDVWRHRVWCFNDTSTDLYLYGARHLPNNYVSTPSIVVSWQSDNNITTGKVKWGFSYRFVAAGASLDQSAQESVNNATGTTVSGTSDALNETTIGSVTAGNFVAGRLFEWRLERLGSDTTNDTMAARACVHDLEFIFADT